MGGVHLNTGTEFEKIKAVQDEMPTQHELAMQWNENTSTSKIMLDIDLIKDITGLGYNTGKVESVENSYMEDFEINAVLESLDPNLAHLVFFRVKLFLKEKIEIPVGAIQIVSTTATVGKSLEGFVLKIMINEKLPIQLLYVQYISLTTAWYYQPQVLSGI